MTWFSGRVLAFVCTRPVPAPPKKLIKLLWWESVHSKGAKSSGKSWPHAWVRRVIVKGQIG